MATPSPLEEIAENGLLSMPGVRLEEAAREAAARVSDTGDARYLVLAQTFQWMNDWWEEHDGIPIAIAGQIDAVITERLRGVLDAEQAPDGYARARDLAVALSELQTGPGDWIARGYLKRLPAPE